MNTVTSEFQGAAFPPGTRVSFTTETGSQEGTVQKLLSRCARVGTEHNGFWNVPYRALTCTAPAAAPAMPLKAVEALGLRLIREHEAASGLKKGWKFAFDLAPVRGGVCRHKQKLIALSVTYCLKASKEEIVDTILHEIAHAIVGPNHNHDEAWKSVARRIGCTAKRCHQVDHTLPRWRGACGCGREWKRQRLSSRTRRGYCPKCKGRIAWQRGDTAS
ncbi:MAG: SprT-like domain-containing protein [Candidatus Poribacteria bacterium]|nr:SprT-like domain-containing protein [Candidatus Poribacteria bacterium]MDE0506661.1 SprT-like domain-containing protein [Candidatus Poribacteria bacterium]